MTAHPWMPFYVANYLADTGHLSTIEHGAYTLLIMHYWQNRGVPTDDQKLARICRATPEEWQAIRATIADLFDDEWRHKRIDAELAKADDVVAQRHAAGKAGASARYGKRIAEAKQTHSIAGAGLPSQSQLPLAAQQTVSEILEDEIESELQSAAGENAPPMADLSPILALLDKGYDLKRDVLPIVRERCAKATKPIGSWRYFVPAIEGARAANAAIKPKANGTPSAPVTWVNSDSRDWAAVADRYRREKGKALIARGSSAATGIGAFVPKSWMLPETGRESA